LDFFLGVASFRKSIREKITRMIGKTTSTVAYWKNIKKRFSWENASGTHQNSQRGEKSNRCLE